MRRSSRLHPCAAIAAVLAAAGPALAAGINTDVALTPPRGGSIFRLQYSYAEAGADGAVRHVSRSGVRGTYVYGVRDDLAFFLTLPYANRQADVVRPRIGRIEEAHDGIADISVFAKYRFWKRDTRPNETLRWAALAGLNVRSGDFPFTSDSYDPIVGTVFTWQRDRGWFDADLVYRFNTGGGQARHDVLRYDLSYSYRLWPEVYPEQDVWEIDAVAELNGRYVTDGSHEVFLAPGLQLITERWILEASVQLPIVQDLDGPETEYRLVVGLRLQW